jgi:dGTPase
MAHEEDILAGDFSAELIDLIPCSEALQALQQRAMDKVYVAPEVLEVGVAGFEVLAGLLQAFVAAVSDIAESGPQASGKSAMLVRLIPQQFTGSLRLPDAGLYRLVLGVTDFVAGMTDSYAVSLYKKITGISLLSSPGD